VFLPGKFVFPGGRVDASDREMWAALPLHPDVERKLLANTRFQSGNDAQALALAAIRETFEETGIVIGSRAEVKGSVPSGLWSKFLETGFTQIRHYCNLLREQSRRLGSRNALMHVSFASIVGRSRIAWKISSTLTLNLSN